MRSCGAISTPEGATQWRVWAPHAKSAELVLIDGERRRTLPMEPDVEGYFTRTVEGISDGQQYAYKLDGGEERQDPCSMWQPMGVPGPSAAVRPDQFPWADNDWKGIARSDLVIYELHVGTFTQAGTFEAIIPRLDSLRELGITAIEIMPIAQFPGGRNWGYDGVLPYAAQNTYGGPRGLAKLIDAAHAAGLAVILDVVYNHMGPESSFLHEFGDYYTEKYKTPWGSAVNYDDRGSEPVRHWVVDNARMWLEDYHLDGLRLDAVHAIYDLGARHILQDIEQAAKEVGERTGRKTHIIAESDLNDPRLLYPEERGGYGLDAQWSDDFHHAVHALLTGEGRGYYSDYGNAEHVAQVLNNPFLFSGDYSKHRGRRHGARPDGIPGDQFVVSIQNHDQVGNRAKGDRLSTLLDSPAKLRLAACLMLLSPYLPMLFMGEEYGETNPFPFFCSFDGEELSEAVRKGRKREFADFVANADEIPDPVAQETFSSAVLSWSWPQGSQQAGLRQMYRDLLSARRHWPALRDFQRRAARLLPEEQGAGVVELIRGGTSDGDSGAVRVYFNLTDQPRRLPAEVLKNGRVMFSSENASFGGSGSDFEKSAELKPFETVAIGG